jgi:dihydropyrimidine dehydrogenase (NAD+) subunit PreA
MGALGTEFLGMTFPNPFILASGPPTAKGEMVIEAFKAGWGGAVLKTIGMVPTPPPSPRVHAMRYGKVKWGFLDIELISDMTVDQWAAEIDMIRDAFPDRPIIASIMGEDNPGSWQEVVRRIEPHGVNAFEMNASCPNFAAGEERGSKLGQDPKSLGQAVSWVREATTLPVIVKLTPNVTDIIPLAQASVDAGADAFCAGNSLSGLGGIDLATFSPLPSVDGIGIVGGYGGPGLRPVMLRITAELAQSMPLHVFGCGGISKWQDAVEYLALGASAVQLCTAVMWEGVRIIQKLTNGLAKYLEEHQFDSVTQLQGKALPESALKRVSQSS